MHGQHCPTEQVQTPIFKSKRNQISVQRDDNCRAHRNSAVSGEAREEVDAAAGLVEVGVGDPIGVRAGHELRNHALPAAGNAARQSCNGRQPYLSQIDLLLGFTVKCKGGLKAKYPSVCICCSQKSCFWSGRQDGR
jgi:hypothetical protein